MKKGIWADTEVKDLFQYVEEVRKNNSPLKQAFVLHARKYVLDENESLVLLPPFSVCIYPVNKVSDELYHYDIIFY